MDKYYKLFPEGLFQKKMYGRVGQHLIFFLWVVGVRANVIVWVVVSSRNISG
jgi:hypothetical protein